MHQQRLINREPMSAFADDTVAGSVTSSMAPPHPAWLPSVVLDASLGVSAYLASYWLRFDSERLATFLPAVWSTAPVVVGAQVLALAAVRAYAPRPRASWLPRVIAGVVLGTAASTVLVRAALGFEGVSRMAFVADALLLSIAAVGWRGVWMLRASAHAGRFTRASSDDLVDRAEEM